MHGGLFVLSSIRLEAFRGDGKKYPANGNIVFRYVLIGKLRSIIIENEEP